MEVQFDFDDELSDVEDDTEGYCFGEDPDSLEDYWGDGPPDLHWIADDHIRKLRASPTVDDDTGMKIPPPLKDWVEVNPMDSTFYVTFGKARRALWDQFKTEHNVGGLGLRFTTVPITIYRNTTDTQ